MLPLGSYGRRIKRGKENESDNMKIKWKRREQEL
jgi:hypothetical protein